MIDKKPAPSSDVEMEEPTKEEEIV